MGTVCGFHTRPTNLGGGWVWRKVEAISVLDTSKINVVAQKLNGPQFKWPKMALAEDPIHLSSHIEFSTYLYSR